VTTQLDARTRRALVVEDDPRSAKLLARVLTLSGWDVVVSIDAGDAAVVMLEGAPTPDVVLLDLDLPEVDGLSLARFLRALPSLRGVPIIAVSASRAGFDEVSACDAGCDAFLQKPIDVATLPAFVASFVDRVQ
jgi:DNA-binding response OmpR family regulator